MSQKIYFVLVLDIIHFKLRHILSDLWYLMFICLQGANLAHQKLKYKQNADAILEVEDVNTALANFNGIPFHSTSVCWVICSASKFSF